MMSIVLLISTVEQCFSYHFRFTPFHLNLVINFVAIVDYSKTPLQVVALSQ